MMNILKLRKDKKVYTALLFNVFFVLEQFGACLLFCVIFHAHSYCQNMENTVTQISSAIRCLHCDHSCEGHNHINNISYAPLPEEKEQEHFCNTVISPDAVYLQHQEKYSCASSVKYADTSSGFKEKPPLLRSVVMRC